MGSWYRGSKLNTVQRKIELLAPGGDVDSIKAAIVAGTDAVYCGLNKFNARNRAANINFDELLGILRLAHKNSCLVFLTLNIIIVESEIPALISLLNKLINTSIDGVIVQDLGMFYLLSKYFKGLKIHASTQLTTHNEGQIKFLSKLNATRVNLSRELNIHEIKALTSVAYKCDVLTEVFVHGSYCISFSGICYMSSVQRGKSGNRGQCSQQCRDRYVTTAAGKDYPLNLKDNSAFFDLKELHAAGVGSLKIEGRIKEFEYVYTVVKTWKKQISTFYNRNELLSDNRDLYKVFNREFSNSYLKGEINRDMFIDNPMSNSTKHHSKNKKDQDELYQGKADLRKQISDEIELLSIEKVPLIITVSGISGAPLKIAVETPDGYFEILSETNLANEGTEVLNYKMVMKRLKVLNHTEYYIKHLDLENLSPDLYITFKELTSIKNRLLFILNGSCEYVKPFTIPEIEKQVVVKVKPSLSILISSRKDLEICNETTADIYFLLPEGLNKNKHEFIDLFKENKRLIPWFSSVLIGEDFTAAIEFLKEVQPEHMVTNNTGIAYEAYKQGIPWIAGPYLNTVNSYSLISLKENFNCSGAFISNEINQFQIKSIKKPDNFKLYYSIYHPIVLMTSRQCLFHQVTGCDKSIIDNTCIQDCDRSATITNLEEVSFLIEKSKGNYHRVYNERNFLNTDIVTDISDVFSSFLIDLSDVETETKIDIDKSGIVKLFENLLDGESGSAEEVHRCIRHTTDEQYGRGIC